MPEVLLNLEEGKSENEEGEHGQEFKLSLESFDR